MVTVANTTPAAIRAALRTSIIAISPTFAEYQDVTWNPLEVDPSGSDLRSFRLLTIPRGIDPSGVYCADGVESIFELRLRTSYGGIDDNLLAEIIQSDLHDIWGAWHPAPGGTASSIPGFISFGGAFLEIEPFDEVQESTDLVVDYVAEVHYKAAVT